MKAAWGIGKADLRSGRNRAAAFIIALVGAAVLAVLIVPSFWTSEGGRSAGPAGLSGQAVPLFALHDDAGAPVSIDQYRNRVVVLNLWASWCPPCRAEMPELQRFADAYRSEGVVVIGVNQGESADRARDFKRSLRIRFPVWLDQSQQYGRAFGALGLPTTVIVNGGGTVTRGFDGAVTFDQVRSAVHAARTGAAL